MVEGSTLVGGNRVAVSERVSTSRMIRFGGGLLATTVTTMEYV
ncbi:hypothetical protein AB9M62_01620 [Bacillales bacterium AN1005]